MFFRWCEWGLISHGQTIRCKFQKCHALEGQMDSYTLVREVPYYSKFISMHSSVSAPINVLINNETNLLWL